MGSEYKEFFLLKSWIPYPATSCLPREEQDAASHQVPFFLLLQLSRPVSAQHSRPVAYEENEIATFYPSITDQDSEAQHVSDDKEECGVQRESMFWGTFIRRA
ncbi:hypothetical protein NDU88_003710 [Pleurodeles waltl]|uniref:Uncharacterized protein n=1 Tax=Pleurodeles waltl TaxID=8319 RepID=A0AAV7LJ79_PLEWA|nr:hypothetical protein NDU88_003710 [Pleurodeles waltl]